MKKKAMDNKLKNFKIGSSGASRENLRRAFLNKSQANLKNSQQLDEFGTDLRGVRDMGQYSYVPKTSNGNACVGVYQPKFRQTDKRVVKVPL